MKRVVIIGAGMGGLSAATRLAQRGYRVEVLEAREHAGGLASGFESDGFAFDAGPYILLDRPGLGWAFEQLGLELDHTIPLEKIEDIYQVEFDGGTTVRFYADRKRTADEIESVWPGAGARYLRYVEQAIDIHERTRPLQTVSRPGPIDILKSGAWRYAPFLLRPLAEVMRRTGLPKPVAEAACIWTHVAGQQTGAAPSPLALVPGLFHSVGAYYPIGGIALIPKVVAKCAADAGATMRFSTKVKRIIVEGGRARAVETTGGERIDADYVISNWGVGTYLELTEVPESAASGYRALPLQSPGVCAYIKVKTKAQSPYLRFSVPDGQRCRLLIQPGVMDPNIERDGWFPARLLAPLGFDATDEQLDALLAEPWWRDQVEDYEVLERRNPSSWGRAFHLYKNSMNPVMTAKFMRQGRLAHRSPHVPGLYLAGSSTHPGQWVSFCAVSGILAADLLHADARH